MGEILRTTEDEGQIARWGGSLVGLGAALTLVAIVIYLTSGAVTPADASVQERADALAAAGDQVALMAYLSIPAGVMLILGAILLAGLPSGGTTGLVRRLAWTSVVVGSLFVLQFDLLMPHLIIPLAHRVEEVPLVFEAVYRASDYIHSVGLVIDYLAFLALFWTEVRAVRSVLPRWVSYGAMTMWSLGLVVGVGLIVGRPMILIAPAILVGWALVAVYGLRTFSTDGSLHRTDEVPVEV